MSWIIQIHLAYYPNETLSDSFELSPQQTWKLFSSLSILHMLVHLKDHTTTLGHKLFAVALITDSCTGVLVGLLLLLYVCHGKKQQLKSKPDEEPAASNTVMFDPAGRVSVHGTEVIGITECMRWSGLLLVLANTWCLLYAELSGSFGSEIYWTSPSLTFGRLAS